jgi:two-component system sensor histidine kinase YesM
MLLIRRLFSRFLDLTLRTKLIISYIFLIAVPTVIIGYVNYDTSSDIILNTSRQNIYEIVKKDNQIIDIKLDQIQESTQKLLLDKDLYEVFSKAESNDDYELIKMDKAVSQILDKYFSQYPDVYSTYMVTSYFQFGKSNYFYAKGEAFSRTALYSSAQEAQGKLQWVPTYDIKDMFGIDKANNLGIDYPKMFSAVKQLNIVTIETFGSFSQAWNSQTAFEMKSLDRGVERPVLVVNFDKAVFDKIFEESVKIKDSEYYILNRDGQTIASSEESKAASVFKPVWLDRAARTGSGSIITDVNGVKMLICFDTLNTNGWISAIATPVESILSTLPLVRYYTLYLGVGLTLIAILLSFIISGWIAKPLKKLIIGIKRMSQGDFNIKIPSGGNDEIGLMVNSFNDMNQKINNLIEENYKTKIREKEAQIMALNLQLNPHFMSNTLNTINWMAIESNQGEISKMIVSLSTMLQYTMRNVKETVRLQEDMEWLKSFLYIMSNRFPGLFTTEYAIDRRLDNQKVPKLFLQPFVENSIIHGFELMESGGVIRITGAVEEEACRICIDDNGKGMTEEEIMAAKNADGGNIGIKNIDKKVKLIFGEDYGVEIRSEAGKGTSIQIIMPYNPY